MGDPVIASQRRTVPSLPLDARTRPSGLNVSALTPGTRTPSADCSSVTGCAVIGAPIGASSARSRSTMVPSAMPMASRPPSGLTAAAVVGWPVRWTTRRADGVARRPRAPTTSSSAAARIRPSGEKAMLWMKSLCCASGSPIRVASRCPRGRSCARSRRGEDRPIQPEREVCPPGASAAERLTDARARRCLPEGDSPVVGAGGERGSIGAEPQWLGGSPSCSWARRDPWRAHGQWSLRGPTARPSR